MVGTTIHTITGSPNEVLAIRGDSVIVGTTRSPSGKPVPLAEIQDAYEQLLEVGEVVITPETVGYRSAFVGAVLASLPGAQVSTAPPRVRLGG